MTSIGSGTFQGCSGLTSITIPNGVTSIGNSAFSNCSGLTSITIPNSVTSIGYAAFSGCRGLASITIPNSVTSIGDYAFASCSGLTSLTIPNSVTTIGDKAFQDCRGLASITIGNGVTNIGISAFDGCNLTSVTLDCIEIGNWFQGKYSIKEIVLCSGVTSIGSSAFNGCSGLTSITIPNSVTIIGPAAFYGCSGLTSITIPNSVTTIGYKAFSGCSGLTSITIPSSVTSIGDNAFYACRALRSLTFDCKQIDNWFPNDVKQNVTEIVIGENVTSIGSNAFSGCSSLTSITIPNSVTSIGSSAFSGCSSLTTLTIPDGVTSIESFAFSGCSGLISFTIPNSVTSIGESAFQSCLGLSSITIPDGVTSIGESAFQSCSALTSIKIPNGVTSIRNSTFKGCGKLTSIVIPNSVTSIEESAFGNCSVLSSITIPDGVTSIGYSAFFFCSGLTSITIPNSVTSIEKYAFCWCSGLTSVTIPNSVTSIGNYAFANCTGLTYVKIEKDTPIRIDSEVFRNIGRYITLYVPQGCKAAYKSAANWNEFKEIVEYSTTLTYSLSITSSTGGSVTYSNNTITGTTQNYTVDEGTNTTLTFTPNSGYRLKSVVLNGTDVTASVVNNQYTVSNISQNTTVNVAFEAIPPTTYTLTISSSGGGDVTYYENVIPGNVISNGTTQSYTVNKGGSANLTFMPNSGYRLKSVVVNGVDITASVVNNQYTISSISQNTTVNVTYEAIPQYTLSLVASGNGDVKYKSITIRNKSQKWVNIPGGYSLSFELIPDEGYRVASVKENNKDVTSLIVDNLYTVSNIKEDKQLEVLFEVIPPTTYTLTISSSGGGDVTYYENVIPGNVISNGTTQSYTVNKGGSANLSFMPNSGYRLKSVVVNGVDITASVVNNQYTISSISQNTTVNVTYEAISQYTLNLVASGNGDVKYKSITIRNKSQEWVNIPEGYSLSFELIPDEGYRVASVKENNKDVTSLIVDNLYTVSNIKEDKQLEVLFEVIPPTTYSLSITSSTGGSVAYAGNTISGTTKSNTVDEGTSHTLTFTPNSGYRLKSVVVNGTDVTASVVNNKYTISGINKNTTVNVTFEVIPQTTYTLTVLLSGDGTVSCNDVTVYSSYKFIVNEGTSHTLTITPNSGYRLKSVVVNSIDVTAGVVNNQYTISNVNQNTTIDVTFEVIPPNTYTLTILSSGGGTISRNGIMVYSTNKFEVDEGTSHTLTFTPNSGYRLKSVMVNGVDVTASVVNNQYTVSNISQNTTVIVTYEAIPQYTLNLVASGNGDVKYKSITIRNKSQEWVNIPEGYSLSFELIPDEGYRVASVKENNKDVTSSIVDNLYTVSNIKEDKQLEVLFEVVPPTTYSLSITSSTGGSVAYAGNAISGTTKSYSVNAGTSTTLTFTPNSGYRLKSVVVNGGDVTASVVNNQYTISNISQNTTVNVTFEAIPPTTYVLSITSSSGGKVLYYGYSINGTYSFTVNEKTSHTLTLTPNSGYRLKSVVVNGGDVTASVVNNQYTIYGISQNITVSVTFEEIPPTTYVLSITSSSGGYVSYSGYSFNGTRNIIVNEYTSHPLAFTPSSGYRLKSVVVNGVDVTANVVNNQYTVSNISQNTTVEVTFVEELKAMTVSGVNYTVTSYDGKTVKVAAGDYGKVLTVPLSFDYDGETWVVYGIESGALANNEKLAAVIWNPFVEFTEIPVNPNLLLYVKSASFAPSSVNNVIVNNVAQKITLEESDSENDFYCPLAFTARSITYSHSYQMTTGIDKCQGWETIALPFDVQTISHGTKGVIVPFAAKTGNSQKVFWLYELTNNGWRAASAVKANTPYIISMPNNDLYYDNARLNGRITFSATDVTVPVTNANSVTYQGRTFTANFEHQQKSRSLFTLNVNNELYSNTSGDEGSQFVAAKRDASPFEAYMTTTNNARTSFGIFEDTSTDIRGIEELIDAKRVNVYNLNGQKRKTAGDESIDELKRRLPAGVYIMNGQKVIVR